MANQLNQAFELTLTAAEVRSTIGRGKIASLLGVEGFVPCVAILRSGHNSFCCSCACTERTI